VILTSSVAAVREDTTAPRVFNESNWNNAAVEAVKTKGSAVGPVTIYLASKTLAEKVAWEFVAAYGSQIPWDLVVINPPWIFGVSLFFCPLFLQLMSLYSLRSAPRQQLMISIPLSAKSMTPCPVRGQVRNYGIREIGCTWLSRQRHMYALHMQQLLVGNGSSSNQVPSFTKISVSCTFRSFKRKPDEYDVENS
jgi:hypothetical protein